MAFGVPAALGLAGAVALRPGVAVAAQPPVGYVPAAELGIAPANSAAANRANLVAALADSAVCVVFAPGDYLVDNGGPQLTVAGFSGHLLMQPGARFVFTSATTRGIVFRGGTGAHLYGVSTAFAARPAVRHDAQECLLFENCVDTHVESLRIDGSAAAGLLFYRCVRPVVAGALIANTMADGLHFANCRAARADRVTTVDTGDDGVAFYNDANGPDETGAFATHISVTNSRSRGIAVTGQSGVTVCGATVDNTVGHGLYCAYEAPWHTRVPTNVHFEQVRVRRGGAWTAAPGGGGNSGLRIVDAAGVTVTDIHIEAPGANGLYASGSTAALSGVLVTGTTRNGVLLQNGRYTVDRLTVDGADSAALSANGCERLEYGSVTARNTSRTSTLRRAVVVENTAYVFGERIWVRDDQPTATGYTVGAYGTQRGSLGTIVDQVDSRDVVVDNPSGLAYTRI
ncbi:hypothetical protein Psuf_081050 [Phytohabitans suffuscus]|uniref:Right handed beta helix domain-containing protein n=1 Tax=Phytohabitans suffuscus TaxID=624315 RepID=A0A6F8YXG8_9ACTN|nr:hypothetical protein Psuf_081050 [Phytohabitans suffuscus]